MEFEVTVQLDGRDVPCGRLYTHVRRGQESASFSYDSAYLMRSDALALSPDLPLGAGSIHTAGKSLFDAFEDCMPDRWGRNLMLRAERSQARNKHRVARALFEGDFLAGVSDTTRQGALRVWVDGVAIAEQGVGVPREVDIPHLLAQADLAAENMDADVRDLLRAGSSLGGARPKASVTNEQGALCIAKFPKADESLLEDTSAWEYVALTLARRCGITVPRVRIVRVAGRSVLILERFDREDERRIPYLSGLSAVQGADGGDYSYLELVDFLEQEGASPTEDIRELWQRILFSCAIGNTDDHMRNHGFLYAGSGWRLSPAFDVNPTPGDHEKYLRCAIDFEERLAVPESALYVCDYFRLTRSEAVARAHVMAQDLLAWKRVASSAGISKGSIEHMESCFDSGIERLRALR